MSKKKSEISLVKMVIIIRELLITIILAVLLNKYRNEGFLFNLVFTSLICQSNLLLTYSKNLKFWNREAH